MNSGKTYSQKQTSLKSHRHTWIVTSVAIIFVIITIFLLPENKSYSMIFMGIAGGHIIIAFIAVFTGWILIPQTFLYKILKKKDVSGFDFGWSPKWMYGFLVASILVFLLAIHAYFTLSGSPILQFVVYSFLLLLAVNFFIGNVIIRNSDRTAQITLPMVNILANGGDKILDAGCGAGRTTIAISQAFPSAKITAFDKFDADYIEEGGLSLLKRNINLAAIENRVNIEFGDILNTNFENNQFDAIVSSFMIDHLRNGKKQALRESFRIMKPGGRFLLIILVRGYTAFGVANFLSLLITPRKTWINWIKQTGYTMICDGNINEGAYFCFEKPLKS